MSELYKNHERCKCCNYWADFSEWTKIIVSATDGHTSVVANEYDSIKKTKKDIGAIHLIACPECKTVIWSKVENFKV